MMTFVRLQKAGIYGVSRQELLDMPVLERRVLIEAVNRVTDEQNEKSTQAAEGGGNGTDYGLMDD